MTSRNNHRATGFRRGTMRLAAALLLGSATSAILAVPAHAQVNDASLRGRVTAPAGGAPTEIVAVEVNTGFRRTSTVTSDGSYNFPSLRVGTYKLEVVTPSGTRSTEEFTLGVAQNATFDFDLSAPAPETTAADTSGDIIVVGNRMKNLEGGAIGVNITQRLIEQLPQNNRNFLAFADLAPGVAFITASNGQSRLQGGAQDSRTVNIFIDGVGQKDYVLKNGITGQDSTQGNPFPQLAVGEYRVISSNYKAEFDQVSSVAITAVTKSGTNEFHGEGFVDYTDQRLRDYLPSEAFGNGVKVKTRDFQFGGALGGPIIKDVMHFFVTYEGKRQQVPVDITPGASRAVSAFPTQYQSNFGTLNRTFNEDLYFGKIDISPTSKDLFEFSAKYRNETGVNLNSGQLAETTATDIDTEELRGLARWQHTEDSWINDFKVAYEDVKWAPTPRVFENGQRFEALNTRTLLLQIGGSANYQNKGQKGWTVSDDFTYTGMEGHTFKIGAKAKWVTLNTLSLNLTNPLYFYNTDFNPNGGTFNDQIPYRVQFGAMGAAGTNPVISSKNFQLGLYAQDDWDVTDRLTLNLGLRWDYEVTPAFLDFVHPADALNAVSAASYPNLTNANYNIRDYISTGKERKPFLGAWQPRVGFTYQIDGEGRFTVFGGYGRSYDRNQFDFLQQEASTGSFTTRDFRFITGDALNTCTPSVTCVQWNPVYLTAAGRAQLLAAAGAGAGRELRFIKNDLRMPFSDQFSLGLRWRVTPLFQAEVGYSHVESKDGFVYMLGNRLPNGQFFTGTAAPSSPFGNSPAGFGSIIIGDNGLETSADTAYLKLTKTYTRSSPWSFDATYTYTQAEENRQFGEVFSLDYPSMDDYPTLPSAGVRKHRIVAAGSVDIPWSMSLSAKLTMASPPVLKGFVNQTTAPYNRLIYWTEGQSNGDRWGLRQVDLAVTKYVPLHFLTDETQLRFRVDIINLFNDYNYVDYNSTATSPYFGYLSRNVPGAGPTTGIGVGGNPPRTIKFSAGFSF